MKKYVHERDVVGDKIGPPYQRVIKHLAAPWNMGTTKVHLATSAVDPGFTSNAHAHDDQEEVFYCVSGKGKIKVDDEEYDVEPGGVVFCPINSVHQLINTGNDVFKCVSAVAPPFIKDKYKKDHLITD
jgi:quercetin dioxygenase-like cupin family protein